MKNWEETQEKKQKISAGSRAAGTLKWKRIRLTAAAAAAAVLLSAANAGGMTMTVWAASGTRYVIADVLNMRTSPGTGSAVAGKLYRGEEVTVISESSGWAKVRVNGKTAYVSSEFLSADKPASAASSSENSKSGSAGSKSTSGSKSAAASAQNTAAADLPDGVVTSYVSLSSDFKYADKSKIHSGSAILYKNTKGKHGSTVICVNAGHGTSGGESVRTDSHPDGTGKVTGGTNASGAKTSMAVSSGMDFADGTPENKVNLKTAQYLRAELLSRGYSVLMIREGSDVQLDNIARTVLANNYADCHVAIHFDSSGSDKGAFFMSVPDALKSMEPVKSTWEKSEAFGNAVIGGLKANGIKIFSGGSMDMDLTQTSYSSVPSIDLELGDKVTDHSDAHLKEFAEGIADGIEDYFNP